jgi:hypothetical protein
MKCDDSDMIQPTKKYIGDSVYAEFDSYAIVLTTENGNDPDMTIFMEPEVIKGFVQFLAQHCPYWEQIQKGLSNA